MWYWYLGNLSIQGRGKVRVKSGLGPGKHGWGKVGAVKTGAILNSRQINSILAKSGKKPRQGSGWKGLGQGLGKNMV